MTARRLGGEVVAQDSCSVVAADEAYRHSAEGVDRERDRAVARKTLW